MTSSFRDFADKFSLVTSVELTGERVPVLNEGEAIASTYAAIDLVAGDDDNAAPAVNGAASAPSPSPPSSSSRVGSGSLYVTTRRVVWVPDAASAASGAPCVSLSYRQIVMHAVATDAASFARPCLYLQLDEGDEEGNGGGAAGGGAGAGEDEDEEGPSPPAPELRLVPADPAQGGVALLPNAGTRDEGTDVRRRCRRRSLSLFDRTRKTPKRPPSQTSQPANKQKTTKTVEPLFQALCDNSALNPDTDAEEQADNPLIFDRLEAMAGAELARGAAGVGEENGDAAAAEQPEEEA